MATAMQGLYDSVVDFLAALDDREFEALIAQARPPGDEEPERRTKESAVEMGRSEALRRHGRTRGGEAR
ncbi:hypothetical protein ABZV91_06695 [Nocardia sp. NPDC004568]|uniref:hypothetical protein n=1 Tax=Nocardia sp. NPDC004568 TaxID=3154551 RepID=UPI0033A27287